MRTIGDFMRLAPVIPVRVIEDPADAGTIARALVAGGLHQAGYRYSLEARQEPPPFLDIGRPSGRSSMAEQKLPKLP
ncbi:MAG: hypothetical protein ACXW27_13955 [Allosphingosinicella sp.]